MNDLQKRIVIYVIAWVKQNNTPVPRQEIFAEVAIDGIEEYAVSNAIDSLIRKGYIARSRIASRTTSYRQLRGI